MKLLMITIWKTIFLEKAPVSHPFIILPECHLTSGGADALPGCRDFVPCLSFDAL